MCHGVPGMLFELCSRTGLILILEKLNSVSQCTIVLVGSKQMQKRSGYSAYRIALRILVVSKVIGSGKRLDWLSEQSNNVLEQRGPASSLRLTTMHFAETNDGFCTDFALKRGEQREEGNVICRKNYDTTAARCFKCSRFPYEGNGDVCSLAGESVPLPLTLGLGCSIVNNKRER